MLYASRPDGQFYLDRFEQLNRHALCADKIRDNQIVSVAGGAAVGGLLYERVDPSNPY